MTQVRSWAAKAAAVAAVAAAALLAGPGAASAAPPAGGSDAPKVSAPDVGEAAATTSRIAGPNRYETAVAIANRSFPGRASTVYLARGDVFADALAAGTLTDGPVLLVPSCGTPPSAVVNKIASLQPSKVIALGGTSSVCDATLTNAAGGRATSRIAGSNRFATARAIADRRASQSSAPTTVYLAAGDDNSPDAVAGGVLTDGPILTVNEGSSAGAAAAWVASHPSVTRVTALGGTSSVDDSVLNAVAGTKAKSRLSGANRYGTAVAIGTHKFPSPSVVYLARGDVFADAVASGSLTDGPVFLTGSCSLPTEVATALSLLRPAKIIALGGTSSVCNSALGAASTATNQRNVSQVSSGPYMSCGISNGNVYCWGTDTTGSSGTTENRYVPWRVPGLSNVTAVSTGYVTACAISGGKAYCWGSGSSGELGNGSYNHSNVPVRVSNLTNVTAISVGYETTCAVNSGKAYCWGARNVANASGQVKARSGQVKARSGQVKAPNAGPGLAPTNSSGRPPGPNTPTLVSGLTNVTEVEAGSFTSCAVSNAKAYCWGDNSDGELGNGTRTGSNAPVLVSGLASVTDVAAAGSSTCAISGGKPYCWGRDLAGTQTRLRPALISGATSATKMDMDFTHACTSSYGKAYCWGSNPLGALGNGSDADSRSAVRVAGLTGVTSVSAGESFSCAVNRGSAYCWGSGDYLGSGSSRDADTPRLVANLP